MTTATTRPPAPTGGAAEPAPSAELSGRRRDLDSSAPRPYPRTRPATLPWYGSIPAHWRELPAAAVYRPARASPRDASAHEVFSLSFGRIVPRPSGPRRGLSPASYKSYQLVEPGDIVVRATDLHNDQTSLRVARAERPGLISSAYLRLRATGPLRPDYAYYFLDAYDRLGLLYRHGSGLRQSLDVRDLRQIPVLQPPPAEQAAISAFLDLSARRLQRLVAGRQRLLALLEEQRDAVIERAVMRGLDPAAPRSSTYVPWLGAVPERWRVVPCRYLFRAARRRERTGAERKLSVTQRRGLVPTDEMSPRALQAASDERFQVCVPGDLVLNKYKAHLGMFWAARARGLVTPNYTVLEPIASLRAVYFEHLFHARPYRDAFAVLANGVTEGMSPLYTRDFYRVPALVPPLSEQDAILEHIERYAAVAARAERSVQRELELLRELHERTIIDVVTGALDVRQAAARLEREQPSAS